MNTFTKIAIAIVAFFAVAHFFPVLMVPFSFIGIVLMLLATIIGLLVGAGLITCAVIVTVLGAVAAALSPIWLPVVVIVGVVSLCRRRERRVA